MIRLLHVLLLSSNERSYFVNDNMSFKSAVDMVGSSTKSESTLLTSATREDAGVEVEVGICRSSSYTILPVESCLHRNITDEAVRNSIDRLAGSIIGNHIEELDELDNPRIDRADLLSKRFSKLAGAFRAHLSGKTTGHHGSWLIETRRRCLKMCSKFNNRRPFLFE